MGYLEKKLQAIIMALDAWKLMTGNLYVMTSNTTPSPFVASAYHNSPSFIYREPYQSLNNNTGDNYQASVNSGKYFGANLTFSKTVKIKTFTVSLTTNTYGSGGTVDYVIDIKLPDNSFQEVYRSTRSQGTTLATDITLDTDDQVECIGIRHYVVWRTGDYTPCLLKKCQVTEWYEKG